MTRLSTVRITALHSFRASRRDREFVDLSGKPLGDRGEPGPISYTEDPTVQDTLLCAQRGTGLVTVGLIASAKGDRIVSAEEVEVVL